MEAAAPAARGPASVFGTTSPAVVAPPPGAAAGVPATGGVRVVDDGAAYDGWYNAGEEALYHPSNDGDSLLKSHDGDGGPSVSSGAGGGRAATAARIAGRGRTWCTS